ARGLVTRYDYDAHGNLLHVQHPIASVMEDFEYNAFGQLTAHVLPTNGSGHTRRDVWVYDTNSTSGLAQKTVIDFRQSELTTSFIYDAVGNLTCLTDPRGHDTEFVVNALDQVVRQISRNVADETSNRYQTDYAYDANNNVVRVDVQNKDE